jgi:large subunit ribosomal protein L7Ae
VYIKLQRQKQVLLKRLKVPPAINQFTRTADKNSATQLFKFLAKYRPETVAAKKDRLLKAAAAKKDGKPVESKKPLAVAYGLNEVTKLVEQKKAKLVVIAHDVDPIEIIVWLPALCRKMDVPYVIVKSKARLGAVVHQKTATTLAIVDANKEDKQELTTLSNLFHDSFNKNADARRQWGGGELGPKSTAALRKKEKALAKEQAAKLQ